MVRVLPLVALAALSFSPVLGIELDVNSVGKAPLFPIDPSNTNRLYQIRRLEPRKPTRLLLHRERNRTCNRHAASALLLVGNGRAVRYTDPILAPNGRHTVQLSHLDRSAKPGGHEQ